MKRIEYDLKRICVLLLAVLLIVNQVSTGFSAFAADGVPSVSIDSSTIGGPRLVAETENINAAAYQWKICDTENGEYTDISGATEKYYDITEADAGKYLRVTAGNVESEPVGPIGQLIVFDLTHGSVTLDTTYTGYNADGTKISGTHAASNIYVVQQSNSDTMTGHNILFKGNHPDTPYDLTLDGVHMGETAKNSNQGPGVGGTNTPSNGKISIPATKSEVKHVIIRLKGENIVRNITYYNGVDQSTAAVVESTLKFTNINGDSTGEGINSDNDDGSLYMPVKFSDEKAIEEYINSKINYNHWNSVIGGTDKSSLVQNLTIAGGYIHAVSSLGDNCTAIGAGGNGYCQMEISGGHVVARCNGTGSAIGGGIGWNAAGGGADVKITGGIIEAENQGKLYVKTTINADGKKNATFTTEDGDYTDVVGGAAIGAGSSFHASGYKGNVTISGGSVKAHAAHGNGIGGGNSSTGTGGPATIDISGGTVEASAIGGGDSQKGVGGYADVTISGTADVTLVEGAGGGVIGGGNSKAGVGGAATVTVTGGTMSCAGIIGGGNGGGTDGHGGQATIRVSGGQLTSAAIGGGTGSEEGDGGAADIQISGGVIRTGSIGGGTTLNTDNTRNLGYAKAVISGGDITGQFLMFAPDESQQCLFDMSGGTLHSVDVTDTTKDYTMEDGGAVYMNDPNGLVTLAGGTIQDCKAVNGGAVYMTKGTFDMSDAAAIKSCTATTNGGAVYLGGGVVNLSGGTISDCKARNGGAIYLGGGKFNVSGGEITANEASGNGGGLAVYDGNYLMYGGSVSNNKAVSGSGGGIYVESATQDIDVQIRSGSMNANHAAVSGGALSVVGDENDTKQINVTIGVAKQHFELNSDGTKERIDCDHSPEDIDSNVLPCPELLNNSTAAEKRGGAIFITGNDQAQLNIYCLIEEGSVSGETEDEDFVTSRISDFLKVEGGTVLISTSANMDPEHPETQDSLHGNIQISSTLYATEGKFDIWGDMDNPHFKKAITVDIKTEGDYFIDHRIGEEEKYYKLLYFENFTDPETGVKTGQYKEVSVKDGELKNISGNIYSHPGYEIVGWNTHPDGVHNGKQEENAASPPDGQEPYMGWYTVNNSYLFNGDPIGDLILYAIWEANGYTVVFDPNAESYYGEMPSQDIAYGISESLLENKFGRFGYDFAGWNTAQDGSGTAYADKAVVKNLTNKRGELVTLYAQWTPCNHDLSTHTYTYALTDQKDGIVRTCSCEGYSETALLHAENAVYDRSPHLAQIVYSDTDWGLEPSYVISGGNGDSVQPVNAGTYVASITAGGVTANITYTIEKAVQQAPNKPVFDVEEDSTELKVKAVADSPLAPGGVQEDPTYDSVKEYCVVYYEDTTEGTVKHETGWQTADDLSDDYAVIFDLKVALTNYYVYARFGEGTNYKASEPTMADSIYFFSGDVQLYVDCGEGVKYKLVVADGEDVTVNGIGIEVTLLDGYYYPESYELSLKTVEAETETNKAKITLVQEDNLYRISEIPSSSKLYLTIPSAKKLPTFKSKITEKEVFYNFADDAADISRDSAFTTYFEVKSYDTSYFEGLQLSFNADLPAGTTLILQDRSESGIVYYGMTLESVIVAEEAIALARFVRMGTKDTPFAEQTGTMKLQIAVDFAGTDSGCAGETLTMALKAKANGSGSGCVDCTANENVTLEKEAEFALTSENNRIILDYTPSDGMASKWDYRHSALMLQLNNNGQSLPGDTYLSVVNRTDTNRRITSRAYQNEKGKIVFIIPVGTAADKQFDVQLVSKTLAGDDVDYSFDVKWIMNHSEADGSPANGQIVKTLDGGLSIQANKAIEPSLKVTADKKSYDRDETVNATISWQDVTPNQEMKVTLLRKNDETGEFASTGWYKNFVYEEQNKGYSLAVPLAGNYSAGSYALQVTIDQGLVNIESVNYYFLIK